MQKVGEQSRKERGKKETLLTEEKRRWTCFINISTIALAFTPRDNLV